MVPHTMEAEAHNVVDSIKLNPSFYFKDDPMAIFLVENQLFRVHRHYLIEGSEFFRGMFNCPAEEGRNVDGMSNEQPIPLLDVTAEDFETLLDFFYSLPTDDAKELDAQEVQKVNLNLLSISHRYVFEKIFEYAVKQLRPVSIPVVERINLGDKYGLKVWLSSAYQELLDRHQVMNELEITTLGTGRVIQFLKAKNFMQEERLGIANQNTVHQQHRAEIAEQSAYYGSSKYQPPVCRTPTVTEIVVRRFFFE